MNYSAGAKSPLSAIFAAVLLMLIVLLVAPLTAYLPVAAMGGVIMMVAYNLVDFHHIKKIMVASRPEASVLIITFVSTLFLELEFAIYLGVLLSLVLFLAKTSTPEITEMSLNTEQRRFVDARNGKGSSALN
nr:SulP family inorganic anion transporter [Aliamphritea spongicola]